MMEGVTEISFGEYFHVSAQAFFLVQVGAHTYQKINLLSSTRQNHPLSRRAGFRRKADKPDTTMARTQSDFN